MTNNKLRLTSITFNRDLEGKRPFQGYLSFFDKNFHTINLDMNDKTTKESVKRLKVIARREVKKFAASLKRALK